MTTNNDVSIIKYVGLFALLYAILMAFFNLLAHGLDIDFGTGANIANGCSHGYVQSICNKQ